MRAILAAGLAGLLALLGACAVPSGGVRLATARAVAAKAGLAGDTISAGGFQHAVFMKAAGPTNVLRVYLEGDGFAWMTPVEISDDPTEN